MRNLNALTSQVAAGVIALALLTGAAPAADAEKANLDAVLKQHAPEIIRYLREHKYQNVGVLKFLVKQGDTVSDNAGPLNLNVANRLEVALVLANPDEQLGIIERASAAVVRSNNRRATHLTPEGRAALFQVREYTRAWGDGKPVEADAFLTGTVAISPDGRTLDLTVQVFDRTSKEPARVGTFRAATDFRTLTEIGRSFALGRGPNESELLAQAIDHSQTIRAKPETNPLETGKSPVELRILYNGTPICITNGTVPEPRKNDRVSFVLINRGGERCGVVLKVNGENTLFREPYDALHCHKWVLGPGEQVKIDGFQMSAGGLKRFEVLSPEESDKDMVNYGEHAGTFSLVVFREAKADSEIATANFDIAAIARGALPPSGERPGTLAVLQAKLREKGGQSRTEGQKGLLSHGADAKREIQYVSFKPDPVPVLAATVRYWQPGR
jgi:hypothetical protein